jgi:hypothetical protein
MTAPSFRQLLVVLPIWKEVFVCGFDGMQKINRRAIISNSACFSSFVSEMFTRDFTAKSAKDAKEKGICTLVFGMQDRRSAASARNDRNSCTRQNAASARCLAFR